MAYAAQSDLLAMLTLAQLVGLTDDDDSGEVNEATVNAELAKASGLIESYTRDRYAMPLQTSVTVTSLTVDLAIYQLYSRRPQQKMPDTIRLRYEDALRTLRDISTGKASLDQPAGATPQTSTAGAVLPTRDSLRFTERDLRDYV